MKETDDCAVNSGISFEDNTYVNLQNLRAQKIENIPNRKETPAAKNTQHQVILILVVLLILMFLILVVLTILLFMKYKSISEEVSQMKNNDTEIMQRKLSELEKRAAAVNERTSELQRNVKDLQKSRSCQSGWVEFEGHCFFFSGFQLNWANAEKMCLNRGGRLVIINSEAEQKFLQNKTNGKYYWIGLTDLEMEGTFKWIDGTGLSYKSWSNGQPDDQGEKEDCGQLYKEGKWNDNVCNENMYAICEKNLI